MIRNPIFPQSFNASAPPGICKWCAEPLPRTRSGEVNKVTKYHHQCRIFYSFATDPTFARHFLYERDKGVCARCGEAPHRWRQVLSGRVDIPEAVYVIHDAEFGWMSRRAAFSAVERIPLFELDHIRPLWSVDRADPEAWRFWQPENAQTLCDACHLAKTQEEAGRRAKVKRIVASDGLRRKKPSQRDRAIQRMRERSLPF